MKVTKKIHPIWTEYKTFEVTIPKQYRHPIRRPIVGKYQYIYESDRGDKKISLIELPNYFGEGVTLWEIYSLEGELFEDVQRFKSKEEAEKKIAEYLEV